MMDKFRATYRPLSIEETDRLGAIKHKASELYVLFTEIGSSREVSLAATKLEEAVMWAVKAATA